MGGLVPARHHRRAPGGTLLGDAIKAQHAILQQEGTRDGEEMSTTGTHTRHSKKGRVLPGKGPYLPIAAVSEPSVKPVCTLWTAPATPP